MKNKLFASRTNPKWTKWTDERILDLRMKDVHIPLERTGVYKYTKKLHEELKQKGLEHFSPYFWFSDEWFTPDGLGGIAIPFYLAHQRLVKIENKFMYEVEGGTPRTFMRLLRHECGHAIDNVYQLRRVRARQKVFGKSTTPYANTYTPKPFSKGYVRHLDTWYAQSHPDEDFAETFAVWLNPSIKWKKRYKGWGALKKLEFMDDLMKSIQKKRPKVKSRAKYHTQDQIKTTLRDHYESKRGYYGYDYPDVYDVQLFKMFTSNPDHALNMKASTFIRRVRREARKAVSPWTGTYQYTINQLIDEIIERADQLDLKLRYPLDESKNQFISMLSVITLEYIHSGRHQVAR